MMMCICCYLWLEYLQEVLEVLMFLLLPAEDFHNTVVRFIIRVSLLSVFRLSLKSNVELLGAHFVSCLMMIPNC